MVLIGLFSLILLWATPASADPISITLLAAVGIEALAGSTIVAVTTFALTFAASAALSFVAQALLKQPSKSGAGGGGNAASVDNTVTVRQAAAARPIVYGQTRVSGIYAHMQATDNNQTLHLVIMFAGHEIEEFSEIWFNDEVVTLDGTGRVVSGSFADSAGVAMHLGASDQLADQGLIDAAGGAWTATDRLQGTAYLYVALFWNAKVYVGGVPNITAVIKGKKDVYDPRTGTTGYSSNPALCLANYLCDTTYGIPVDYATGIDETALIAAANACDEDVTLAGGGTEKRYSADGVLQSSGQPQAIIGQLLGAMHGRAPYDGERWKIIAGVYQTPTLTFTDDDLRAGPKIQTLVSRRDLFNACKGTFIGPDAKWQEADFPVVKSTLYKAQDGGQEIWKDYQLPLTRSPSRAQRIVKIDLLKARQPIVATMPGKLTLWQCQAGDTIGWTSQRYGWTNKPFEVGKATFSVDSANGAPTLGVDLELREIASDVYAWSTSEEATVDPAPNTNFPAVFDPMPPSNLAVTESLYSTRTGGGVKAKATLSWEASPDAFVTSGGGYLVEFRVTGAPDWVPLPQTGALTLDILDIDPGTYDFRVFSVNWAGNRSATPLQALGRNIAGLASPPAAPQGLTVNASGGLAIARWTLPVDLDVLQGGNIVFRHSALSSAATWADGVSIADPLAANAAAAILPLKAGTYMAKFVDSTGHYSASFASFVQVQASVLSFTTLDSVVEDPGYAGTKTHMGVDAGVLMLDAATDFDSVAEVDALPSWDFSGGVVSSGSYGFANKIDLGSVKKCRLTVAMTTQVQDMLDNFDARPGDIDDWPSWDGQVSGNEADAWMMVRTTRDDPNGVSPAWTDWQRIDSADFETRGFDLRIEARSADTNFNILISAADAVVERV